MISPQGYEITKDPKNNNPFWKQEDEGGQYSTQITYLNRYGINGRLSVEIEENVYRDFYLFNNMYAFRESVVDNASAQTGFINSKRLYNNEDMMTRICYNFYTSMAFNDYGMSYYDVYEVMTWLIYDIKNDTNYGKGQLSNITNGQNLYEDLKNDEIPTNIKCVEYLTSVDDDGETKWRYIYIPYIDDVKAGNYKMADGLLTIIKE